MSQPPQSRDAEIASLVKSSRPHPWELALHPIKGIKFILALATDRRISMARKALYVIPLLVLVAALIAPESIIATIVALAMPLVGPVINIPADVVVDWALIGLAAYALLAVLPTAIVSEHHAELFHPKRVKRWEERHGRVG